MPHLTCAVLPRYPRTWVLKAEEWEFTKHTSRFRNNFYKQLCEIHALDNVYSQQIPVCSATLIQVMRTISWKMFTLACQEGESSVTKWEVDQVRTLVFEITAKLLPIPGPVDKAVTAIHYHASKENM